MRTTGDETWRERVAFWSHRALAAVAPWAPEAVGRAVARAVGTIAYRVCAGVRRTVASNQARVLDLDPGDARVRRSTHAAFRLYAQYWFDTFHLRALDGATLTGRVDVPDLDRLDAVLSRGRGCVLVLPHVGNWDVAGRMLALRGYRVAAVAENLKPARLATLHRRHRERLGMRIVVLAEPLAVLRELRALLMDNWVVALVADRAIASRGIDVEMFGARRRIPVGPALLALETGAPLAVAAAYTVPSGWRIQAGASFGIEPSGDRRRDVAALCRVVAAELEHVIAAHPADWHLFQPGWP